ncbi:hypothetical protein [Mycolicibacterium phlei]|nr:hypothetical protein [Mycolicibacterium phlei]EID13660.1 hypothetical protein MPHLEI_12886 [Mycolicibacterium phlei RIVM601174]MBF4195295.1 hypothetical protein [Mycolicibacterium phlei]
MTSSTPPEGPYEPQPDESDTGPIPAVTSHPRGTGVQRDSAWDTPLIINPRPVRRQRNLNPVAVTAAVLAAVAVGAAVYGMTRQSGEDVEPAVAAPPTTQGPQASAEDEQLLQRLPKGYRTGACEPADPPEGALAQVICERNTDAGGPLSGTYTLVEDRAQLEKTFRAVMDTATRVDCPGRIQSPGPWRRNATPDRISGQLFCGLRDGDPMIAWTDDVKMTVSAVRSGADGPTFPQLYAWWSKHS